MVEGYVDHELGYLRDCVMRDETIWRSFEACDFDLDLFCNTNKVILTDRMAYLNNLYEVAKESYIKKDYYKSTR